ncbi:MAG: GlsB/YeaQ/YmgE family stress response membrane protein [Bacillota bacterium]
MGILSWIIFGALVGWVAAILMKTRKRGLIRNIVIGIVGSFIGGWIGSFFGVGSTGAFTVESFVTALIGAVLLIWLLRKL